MAQHDLSAVPTAPTMSLHDIANRLWAVDKTAYYNLRYYIEERDLIADALHDAVTAGQALMAQLAKTKTV